MITELKLKNFKNFSEVSLELNRVNVFIGPNNSGKSNLLKSLMMLKDIYGNSDKTKVVLARMGGIDILHGGKDSASDVFSLGITAVPPESAHVDGKIHTAISSAFYSRQEPFSSAAIAHEHIETSTSIHGGSLFSATGSMEDVNFAYSTADSEFSRNKHLEGNGSESVFNQQDIFLEDSFFRSRLYPHYKKNRNSIKSFYDGVMYYGMENCRNEIIFSESTITLRQYVLSNDGNNFYNVIQMLDQDYDFIDHFVHYLNHYLKGLKKFKLNMAGEDIQRGVVHHEDFQDFSVSRLSAGSLKLFLLTLMLHTPVKYTTLMIDEPELNMHPAWLKALALDIEDPKSCGQLIVSTHSPELLDGLTAYYKDGRVSLFVFDCECTVRKVKPADIDEFLTDGWELGDLYRVGEPRLGGWPW